MGGYVLDAIHSLLYLELEERVGMSDAVNMAATSMAMRGVLVLVVTQAAEEVPSELVQEGIFASGGKNEGVNTEARILLSPPNFTPQDEVTSPISALQPETDLRRHPGQR